MGARRAGGFPHNSELFAGKSLQYRAEARRHPLMHEFVYPMIYWPAGMALGIWLFFEIARRM
jgi:hypothetical protein